MRSVDAVAHAIAAGSSGQSRLNTLIKSGQTRPVKRTFCLKNALQINAPKGKVIHIQKLLDAGLLSDLNEA